MTLLNKNPFSYFIQQTNLLGTIKSVDSNEQIFSIQLRSDPQDIIDIKVKTEAQFSVLMNLDGITNDQFSTPSDASIQEKMNTYLIPDTLVGIEATLQKNNQDTYIGADIIHILINPKNELLFEQSEWWINQISRMADEWLDDVFGDNRQYTQEDFAQLYRTNLNTYGLDTDDTIQETATLSRLIYGLSSAYHLTGCTRYLDAAQAGVEFQRSSFKNVKSDGESCFWAYGRRRQKYGTEFKLLSENPDDFGTIPLYEQIYAIAGLAQYYRITADPHALEDIRRTVTSFNKFYLDKKSTNPEFPGLGGYFSHLDHASLRPDVDTLGVNKSRKNWNSIGDHIPAYLINILLALKPLPSSLSSDATINQFVEICEKMFDECIDNIIQHFPDKNPQIPYVNERFFEDWKPDHHWGWQQNRAIVGHNLKIAWNLTRAANYYEQCGQPLKAIPAINLAKRLADSMATYAVDPIHGGCFDAVEREPKNNMPLDMVWKSTKDFWQQEQCILAYLILYGKTKQSNYLELARETLAFWNLYFLDRDNRGVFFRVSDIGRPVFAGSYGDKAGHAIAGYHSFELNFLANLYMRTAGLTNIGKTQNSIFTANGDSARDSKFCLYFKLHSTSARDSINVRPDYTTHNQLSISGIAIDGVVKSVIDPSNFQISIPSGAQELVVQYKIGGGEPRQSLGKIGVLIEKHFDETEYNKFNTFFPLNGYEVEYMSYLWGENSATYQGNDFLATCTVTTDIQDIDINDYAGFIFIGGYAMDRLRYEEHPDKYLPNHSPAVNFARKLMENNKLIGTICHSLWLLTVDPTLIRDRKVTCAHNIIYDVVNAGAQVIYEDSNQDTVITYQDRNLVTGKHPGYVDEFCDLFLNVLKLETYS